MQVVPLPQHEVEHSTGHAVVWGGASNLPGETHWKPSRPSCSKPKSHQLCYPPHSSPPHAAAGGAAHPSPPALRTPRLAARRANSTHSLQKPVQGGGELQTST